MIQTLFGSVEQEPSLLEKLKSGVQKTRAGLVSALEDALQGKREINADLLDELEFTLISADVGVRTTEEILDRIRERVARHQLNDAAEFRAVIARCGAELVLFGHTHVSALGRLKTPSGSVPAIGVPSASARPHRGKDHSRYHLYRIASDGDGWRVDVEVRGVGPSLDRFADEARFDLAVPA